MVETGNRSRVADGGMGDVQAGSDTSPLSRNNIVDKIICLLSDLL